MLFLLFSNIQLIHHINLSGELKLRKIKIFFINGIILTITAIVMRCIGLVFNIAISNKIGLESVGIFSLVMSIYLFFVTLANSGLSMAVTYTLSEKFAENNNKLALKAIRTSILFALILGVSSGIFIIILSPYLTTIFLYNAISSNTFYLIAIGLPFIAMSSCINGYFSAVRKSYKTAFSQVLELIIRVVLSLFLLQIAIPKSVEEICKALILSDVISEIVSFSYLYISYYIDKKKTYNISIQGFRQKKKIIQIAFPIAVTSYMRSGLSTLKQLLIPTQLEKSGLSTSVALSGYGIITGMVMPLLMFSNVLISSFSGLLIPEISTYQAQKNNKAIHFVCNKIFYITSCFSIYVASIFLIFSEKISLIAYKNTESSLFLCIMAPLIFFMYMDNVIDSILKGLNKQFSVMIYNIIDLLLTIILIYFLLPIFGIYGYLASIFISEIFNFCISLFQLIKTINLKIDLINWVLIPIICSFSSYFVLIFLSFNFNNLIIDLIVCIILFTFFYIIKIYLIKKFLIR